MFKNSTNPNPRAKAPQRWIAAAVLAAAAIALALPSLAQDSPATATAPAAPAPSSTAKAQAQSHLDKAKTLYDQQKYTQAQAENDQALQLDPANSTAVLLRRVLAEKIASSPADNSGPAPATAGGSKIPVLDPQQISAIRLMELTPADRNIRGKIDRTVLEDFWQDVISKDPNANLTPENHQAWLNPGNFALQLRTIKASADPHFTDKISITSDPQSISGATYSFATVQTYMLQNCATSDCHGGAKAGDFRLIPNGAGATRDQQLYTNFYIMSMFKTPAPDGGKMIDRDNPDRSLFLTYSLPHGHPVVDIPRKMQATDLQYRRMIDWIKTLTFPQPSYGITYQLPGGTAAPAQPPASAPASTQK